MKSVLGTLALAALIALPASAGSLINKDSSSYDIAVKSSGGTMKTSISGGTTKSGICSSDCKITVEGVGEIEIGGSDDAVIKNGKLEKK